MSNIVVYSIPEADVIRFKILQTSCFHNHNTCLTNEKQLKQAKSIWV